MKGITRDKTSSVWIVSLVVAALAVGITFLLVRWRPNLFHLVDALPATVTYFGLFALLDRYLRGRLEGLKALKVNEGLAIVVLLIVGAAIGSASGIVWWSAGGWHTHTFQEAFLMGAVLGLLPIVCLVGGA